MGKLKDTDKMGKYAKSDLVDVKYRDADRKVDRPAQTNEIRKMPKGKK